MTFIDKSTIILSKGETELKLWIRPEESVLRVLVGLLLIVVGGMIVVDGFPSDYPPRAGNIDLAIFGTLIVFFGSLIFGTAFVTGAMSSTCCLLFWIHYPSTIIGTIYIVLFLSTIVLVGVSLSGAGAGGSGGGSGSGRKEPATLDDIRDRLEKIEKKMK